MRGPLVTEYNTPTTICLALGFAFHQHRDTACQNVNLLGLVRDDVAEVIGRAFEMCQSFFEFLVHLSHCLAPLPTTG